MAVALLGLLAFAIFRRKHEPEEANNIHLPHDITPFSVIGVLREIHRNNGLSTQQKDELEKDIHRLEGAFFSPDATRDADLKTVVESWLKRARV